MPTAPSGVTWTIRFKYNKTTVLLHADPLQTFDSLKEDLLSALKQTNKDGLLHGHPLPESADEIILGKAVDVFDLSKGFSRLDVSEVDDVDADAKKKGRPAKDAAGKETLKGAGLRDNAVLAFKWGEDAVMIDKEGMEVGEEQWDVQVPTYEDAYGAEVAEQ